MNFLAEVLSSAEKVELKEVDEKVADLKLKVDDIETQIVEYMKNVYLKFSKIPKKNKRLPNEVNSLEKEVDLLMNNIDIRNHLSETTSCIEEYKSTLNTIKCTLEIVTQLCQLNEQLITFDHMLEHHDHLSCMKLISEYEAHSNQILEKGHLEILQEIQLKFAVNKHALLNELSNVFSDHVIMKYIDDNHIIMKIKKDHVDLQKALNALYYSCPVISLLSQFACSLWKYFIVPAVDNSINLAEKEDDLFNVLEITIDLSKKKSPYPVVFSNLKTILQFLKVHFDLEIGENISSMKVISEDIRDNISELIVKHCLEDTIPSTAEDLQNYKKVMQEIEEFQKTLQSYNIFTEDTNSLTEFASNIDIRYINKICKENLLMCEVIMKKDLHDMIEVKEQNNPPYCVSKSAIELMNFLGKIMLQATYSSKVCAGHLLLTVKNIVIKYGYAVPQYHNKLLQTIPQQVAIFQNNCFYIGCELTKLKETYSSQLSPKLDATYCNFTGEVYQIQQIGRDFFSNYVQERKDNLIITGIEGPMLEDLSPETEKCIRQCMRQQELLKTVWHKVLPYSLYNNAMGIFLDCMCSKLVNSVVSIEDISSKAAELLVEVFKIVINRGPKLFTDPQEINLFVRSWYKFNELNYVLSAGLIDINNRWADGKGPLALQFNSTEMKSLIRALFQNTDRRAAILANIKN